MIPTIFVSIFLQVIFVIAVLFLVYALYRLFMLSRKTASAFGDEISPPEWDYQKKERLRGVDIRKKISNIGGKHE